MNPLQAHQALRAAADRKAVARASRRHIHLSSHPLVIVGYHLAGDQGATLALLWGTSPNEEPHCMIVPEPRNRALRFRALAGFAGGLIAYVSKFTDVGADDVCLDAPQIVTANSATVEWLTGIVGRFTRNLTTEGDDAAPPTVPLAGKHLSFFADLLPGSSLLVSATDALSLHWQTGQLPSEDLNLAAVLGWVDPPAGMDGPEAARIGEAQPPAGPDTDPAWDDAVLTGLIREWHTADDSGRESSRVAVRTHFEAEIRDQLMPAWDDCWHALELLESLPAADHVAHRWEDDRRIWTKHCDRIADGRAFFRNIPTPVQAAERLRRLEERTHELECQMALDDELVMAAVVASGDALAGQVVAADLDRRIAGPSRRVRRPLITVAPSIAFAKPRGTKLYLRAHPSVELDVMGTHADGRIDMQVVAGACRDSTVGLLPTVGDWAVMSPFGGSGYYPHSRLDQIPWTHQEIVEDEDE